MSLLKIFFASGSMASKLFALILISALTYSANSAAPILNPGEIPSNSTCKKDIKFTLLAKCGMWWLGFYVSDLCCTSVAKVYITDYFHYNSTFVRGYQSQETTKDHYWIFDPPNYPTVGGKQFIPPITVRVVDIHDNILTYTDIFPQTVGEHTYYSDKNFNTPNCTVDDSGNSVFNIKAVMVQVLIYIVSFYLYF
eukprot:808455_1